MQSSVFGSKFFRSDRSGWICGWKCEGSCFYPQCSFRLPVVSCCTGSNVLKNLGINRNQKILLLYLIVIWVLKETAFNISILKQSSVFGSKLSRSCNLTHRWKRILILRNLILEISQENPSSPSKQTNVFLREFGGNWTVCATYSVWANYSRLDGFVLFVLSNVSAQFRVPKCRASELQPPVC